MQLEEIDDDTMVEAPMDFDQDALKEETPPVQELLDNSEDPLPDVDDPVLEDPLPDVDDPVQRRNEDELAITENSDQEEERNEVHTQEQSTVPRGYLSRKHRKPARFEDGFMQ